MNDIAKYEKEIDEALIRLGNKHKVDFSGYSKKSENNIRLFLIKVREISPKSNSGEILSYSFDEAFEQIKDKLIRI